MKVWGRSKRVVYRSVAILLSLLCVVSVQSQLAPDCDSNVGQTFWSQVREGRTCKATYTCSAKSPPVQIGQEPRWMYIFHVGGTADIGTDVVIDGPDSVAVINIQGGFAMSGIITDTYRGVADGISEGDEVKGCFCSINRDGPNPWDTDSPVRIMDMDGWTVRDTVAAEIDGFMSFLLEFPSPVVNDLTVKYRTANGTALAGSDYIASIGTVTVRRGYRSAKIRIPIIYDQVLENPETFKLLTESEQFAGIGTLTAVGTIVGSPYIVLDPDAITVTEGRIAGYTVSLGEQPSGNVTVTITEDQSDLLEFNNSLDRLTFTRRNWNQVRAIYVAAKHDSDIVDDMSVLVHTASGGGFDDVSANLPITIVEDDVPGIVLSPTSLEIQEGRTDSYTAVLATQPSTDITVLIFDEHDLGVRLSATKLIFTDADWNVPKTVTVTTQQDNNQSSATTVLHHVSFDAEYDLVYADLPLLVKDAGMFELMTSPMVVNVREGSPSTTFTVWLSQSPFNTVYVNIGLNDAIVGKTSVDPTMLVFTTTNWSTPQVVTVVGLDDDDGADESGLIQLRSRGGS